MPKSGSAENLLVSGNQVRKMVIPKESHCPSSGKLIISSASFVLYERTFSMSDKFRQDNPWDFTPSEKGRWHFITLAVSLIPPSPRREWEQTKLSVCRKVLLEQAGKGSSWPVNI